VIFCAYSTPVAALQNTTPATGSAGCAARRDVLARHARPLHNRSAMFPSLRTTRAGFTLIELMMAIAVMAILLMVAAPGLRDLTMNVRLTGQANDLLTDLMFARSEATKRDVRVTVCARKVNTTTCTNGNQWDNGWMVGLDADGDGEIDAGTVPLKIADPLTGQNTIKNSGSGKKGSIVFTATGINDSGPATLTICDSRKQGRAVNVAGTGRASVTKITSGCT
jgi:type IV fimbrial biogenesis protein FimT